MKVLIINGSPHGKGNTRIALDEMVKIFDQNEIESEIIHLGHKDIRGCLGCMSCKNGYGKCVINDVVNEMTEKFANCDGLVVGTPVYFGSANATLIAFLTRLFYSTPVDKTMKVGASVVVARRGGISATYDEINKFFAISGMPIASSQYWNGIHGRESGEASKDEEGLQTMRVLARNMSFLIKCIHDGKEKYGLPEKEEFKRTNFIR
ncbi:flavodoxin family protein [Thomasclavelia sp.]|uniref:flavodoxin family protein n=1 Tax=Thomasclavelia sp. TaxID=3025757 RepID=UPI0025E94ADE|nr:flavodoxin family protein [Thomasclavelia sp.]